MVIRPEPLTKEAFMPFGDVIEFDDQSIDLINDGRTRKCGDLAGIECDIDGRSAISIYRSQAVQLPFCIETMERHQLGSQAFFPLHKRPFPIVVAAAGASPGAADLRAFLSNGKQGISLKVGVWHHYQLSLEQESDYLVVDRVGADNCDEISLEESVLLKF